MASGRSLRHGTRGTFAGAKRDFVSAKMLAKFTNEGLAKKNVRAVCCFFLFLDMSCLRVFFHNFQALFVSSKPCESPKSGRLELKI